MSRCCFAVQISKAVFYTIAYDCPVAILLLNHYSAGKFRSARPAASAERRGSRAACARDCAPRATTAPSAASPAPRSPVPSVCARFKHIVLCVLMLCSGRSHAHAIYVPTLVFVICMNTVHPIGRYGNVEGLGTPACSGACGKPLDCPIG